MRFVCGFVCVCVSSVCVCATAAFGVVGTGVCCGVLFRGAVTVRVQRRVWDV